MRIFSHDYTVSRYKGGKLQGIIQHFQVEFDALEFARTAAFEEVFDGREYVRRRVPIYVVPWSQKITEYQDGITVEDCCIENANNPVARRVYDMPVEPKPSPGPAELKGFM